MPGSDVMADLQAYGWTGFLLFLRVGGVVGLAPVFGEHVLPIRLRAAAAFAVTLCLYPFFTTRIQNVDQIFFLSAFAEVLTGLCFGLLLRFVILALQMVGIIIAQSMSLAQVAGTAVAVDPAPAIGNLLMMGGLAVAASGGLHVQLLQFLLQSYDLVPLGQWPVVSLWAETSVACAGRITAQAFALAMPFVALSLFYNILLGVMSRAMPQLMVVMIGAPIIVGLSLLSLAFLTPTLLQIWHDHLLAVLTMPEHNL